MRKDTSEIQPLKIDHEKFFHSKYKIFDRFFIPFPFLALTLLLSLFLLRDVSFLYAEDSQNTEKALKTLQKEEGEKYFKEGMKLYKNSQYEEAIRLFDQSLSIDPTNSRVEKYKAACVQQLHKGENQTPIVEEPKKTVREKTRLQVNPSFVKAGNLYDEGRDLITQGKFEEAQKKFEQALELNPYHVAARKYVILLQNRHQAAEREKQAITEDARMIDVQKEWLPPKKEKISLEIIPAWKVPVGISEARKRLEAQTEQIIPAINFNNAHLSDVIKYLSRISGVNIIVDESVLQALSSEEIPAENVPEEAVGPNEPLESKTPSTPSPTLSSELSKKSDRVTITVKDVPLIEALRYVLRAKGLRYMIEDYAIIVVSGDYIPPEEFETRYYHLSSGVGAFTSFSVSAAEKEKKEKKKMGEEGSEAAETITIKDILEQSGVPWPIGSKIFLDQRTGTLIVRNTPTNLKIVEDILRTLDIAPYQVAITARFIELENTDAEEMGLEWLLRDDLKFFINESSNSGLTPANALERVQFDRLTKTVGGKTLDQSFSGNLRYLSTDPLTGFVTSSLTGSANPIVAFSGILTRPEFSIILHALSQRTKSNVLSSPRVTTVNGQRAQIKVVQEFIYPTQYDVTPATTNSQGSVTTPPVVSPGNFQTRDIGIVLNVTPNVGADRKTINLTIIPEVSEFVTWLDYGVPTQTFLGTDGVTRTLPGYPILQPLFASRNVTTSVIVNDTDTVVLGGLIRDQITAYHDKIPVLGDIPVLGLLFKKKGEISVKKNLIIFVTAELVTPSGDPYAPTQFEPGETLVPKTNPEAPLASQPSLQPGLPKKD
ncbi:MAG: tetratricopeptide repeat protein [Chlamydiae bacterium]|nr:tetratricopeptide repeat protein [Chlamydiota bacterium]MBI3277792.1 tetratricopeptide repeat protein [Chlamydiota bacterium]